MDTEALKKRIAELAYKNDEFFKKLKQIAALDRQLIPSGIQRISDISEQLKSSSFASNVGSYDRLCDDVAREVAGSEDFDEIGMWISYNIHDILRAIKKY